MYEVMCCDFRFAIAKVLILPKAKKLLYLKVFSIANSPFLLFHFLPFYF